jgi:hypothetical protein
VEELKESPTVAASGDGGLLITIEEVALMWFGEVGKNGSASTNCQRIRRLIPHVLPARRIGNRWYVNRAIAEAWAGGSDSERAALSELRPAKVGGGVRDDDH